MKYKNIYNFEVFMYITDGKTVCALDRAEKTTCVVNEITVCDAVSLIKNADEDEDRFAFWVEEEVEETEENDNERA
jgi:hypothetical protein